MRAFFVCVATGLAVASFAAAAHAQPATPDEGARAEFDAATTAYREGRFAEAATRFEAVYERTAQPEILFNVYVAHRDAGAIEDAAAALRRYLTDAPAIAPDERRQLESRLAAMEARIAETRRAPETTVAPPPASPEPAPGAAPEPAPRQGRSLFGPIVALAGGATALGVAAILGLVARGIYADLEDACPGGACPPDRASDIDRLLALDIVADVFLVGGAIATVIGLVGIVGAADDRDEAPRVHLDARPIAGGAMGDARWLF